MEVEKIKSTVVVDSIKKLLLEPVSSEKEPKEENDFS